MVDVDQKEDKSNFPKTNEITKSIEELFKDKEPAELIFAEILTLPDKKVKENIYKELAQKYWACNTELGHNLSIRFAKFGKHL